MRKMIAYSALALSMAAYSMGSHGAIKPADQAPTIRTLSGAENTRSLDKNATALIVIDFQNEYFEENADSRREKGIGQHQTIDRLCT